MDHAAIAPDCTDLRPPDPGDFSLCVSCGALAVFDESLQLQPPTQAEMQIAESSPNLVAVMQALRVALALYRPKS
jgi:hypothetical protein